MKEKIIVALATLNVTLMWYIFELPHRPNYAPGGEFAVPLLVFLFWLIGHEIQQNEKRRRKYADYKKREL
ncbi:Uncharacterised protein [Alloiococcus otitis]|uniref:Uncharacterized protein n=1 Tax=Alloiococcus otitis ATCC 51267 TaxID=883081 RepID=K9ER91_9LACT|nr:hypothetical protein [Alloiococcus otitis]EKU93387.1 hypothetical protein HMPREF9698_01135 [Alloiococcus otitis ATCC 51267]SUU81604.1 Uncharacterised protein [Alloiococcus otitis]